MMIASVTALTLGLGLLLGGSVWLILAWARRPGVNLAQTVTSLGSAPVSAVRRGRSDHTERPTQRLPRIGAWVQRTLNVHASAQTQALLRLRGISEEEHFGSRAVCALLLPLIVLMPGIVLGAGMPWTIPTLLLPLAAVGGWFYPLMLLRRGAAHTTDDAQEALLVYIDLVILERLSNASIHDALHSAAAISDAPLFRQIRTALARADLEQEQPWHQLERLAEEISMPQLKDVADISRLQAQGAALSEPLRARVKELRYSHLTRTQQASIAITQRMSVWGMLPVLIVLCILVAAPLIKIALGQV